MPMKGSFSRLSFVVAVMALPGGAAMGQEVPEGWHLQEEDMGGYIDLNLAWYEPGSGDVKAAISCQKGYADVVVTIYVDGPASDTPVAVALEKDGTRFAFESPVSDYNGYSVGTITSFGPELTALLQGGFAVSLDGVAHGDFGAKSGKEEIDRILEACPAG